MTQVEVGSAPRVDAILARAALTEPLRAAVVQGRQSWTYAEVYERACRLAGALAALGVRKGDRVALWTTNRPEFVEVFFGVPMLGAIAAPLDFWWNWKDAHIALVQIRPKVLIVGAAQAEAVIAESAGLRALGIEHVLCLDEPPASGELDSYQDLLAAASRLSRPTAVVPSDPAVILFTSGSTGRSKGAVHTHRSLTASAMIMALELALQDGERTLHFLPMFSSCLEHLLPLTMVRATHVIVPHFDARAVWGAIRDSQITHIDAVPTTLKRLLEVVPAEIPPSLRLIGYASERMPEALISALIEPMPTVRFVHYYGMYEQLSNTLREPGDQLRKIGTVGRPMLGAQMYLLNGEIVARSPTLFAGYWQDDAATAQVMSEHWMRTGDIGTFDAEGFLRLEGRIKEIIKSGGMTVIPGEVETALLEHPAVSDVAVVGVPDAQWGEAVHAFVILASGVTLGEPELKAFCHDRLIGYKRPKVIHIVTELPRTGIGKIARRVVRERALGVV
jgi:acyl-CoA synthetase (AMP-forming)/AMP-acid ligase II